MNDFTIFTPPNVHPFSAEAEIRELKDRVSALEALTPKAAPLYTMVDRKAYESIMDPKYLVTQQRRHFIPDYGSEGEY